MTPTAEMKARATDPAFVRECARALIERIGCDAECDGCRRMTMRMLTGESCQRPHLVAAVLTRATELLEAERTREECAADCNARRPLPQGMVGAICTCGAAERDYERRVAEGAALDRELDAVREAYCAATDEARAKVRDMLGMEP